MKRARPIVVVLCALSASCSKSDGGSTGPTTTPDTNLDVAIEAATLAPPGCFSGAPSQPLEFLNACTDADFVVFDNCARLGFCADSALPDRVAPPVADSGAGD
ncbi:MAG: hypothetical protein ACHREM_23720 [Polyangiales bacterium]